MKVKLPHQIQPKREVPMSRPNCKNKINMNDQDSMSSIKSTSPKEVFTNENYLYEPRTSNIKE